MWLTIFMVIISFFLSGCSLVPPQPSTKSDSDSSTSPSPISYIGWQEYINDKYHYQIKYPHDWYFHLQGYNPPPPTAIMLANVPEGKTGDPHVSFTIFVDKRMDRDLSNYEEISSLVSQGYIQKDIVVSGSPAVLVGGIGENEGVASVYVQHQDYIFRLGWNGTGPDVRGQFRETVLKILGSFTFTD